MKDNEYKVGGVDLLSEDGDRLVVDVEGNEIAVFNIQGEYYALANFCVHQGAPLCEGEVRGQLTLGDDEWEWLYDESKQTIICPWHCWNFDIESGEHLHDKRHSVPTFDVEERDGDIYIRY